MGSNIWQSHNKQILTSWGLEVFEFSLIYSGDGLLDQNHTNDCVLIKHTQNK